MRTFSFVVLPIALACGACTAQEDLGNHGQPNPGPSGDPHALRMFVTSTAYSGDLRAEGNGSSGIAGADALCAQSATAAALDGDFIAYISDSSTDAIDRVMDNGPWYTVDRKSLLFPNKAALGTSPRSGPENPEAIIKGEFGLGAYQVWTGTSPAGRRDTATCKDWTSTGSYGTMGTGAGADWQHRDDSMCEDRAGVFCIERSAATRAAHDSRKRVFTSSAKYTGNLAGQAAKGDGFTAGDALCTALAQKAKLGGDWKAWLSGPAQTGGVVHAPDRLTDSGGWYLLDRDTLVFESKARMVDPPLHAIDLDELSRPIPGADDLVWTGSDTNSCLGWTTSQFLPVGGPRGASGNATTPASWSGAHDFDDCNGELRLYCFEQ